MTGDKLKHEGYGLEVKDGEVMFLLDKTNQDRLNIRKYKGDNVYIDEEKPIVKDVMLKVKHTELGPKMDGRQHSQETDEKINSLVKERKGVLSGWQEKEDWLKQVTDLQLFNGEADQLDASTSTQAKLLENLGVGDNFEVRAIIHYE